MFEKASLIVILLEENDTWDWLLTAQQGTVMTKARKNNDKSLFIFTND